MRRTITPASMFLLAISASPAAGVTIANQMPSDQADGTVSGDMIFIGTTRVADDFTIPASLGAGERGELWGITRLRGTLITSLSAVGGSAGFEIYRDGAAGLPGQTIPMFTGVAWTAEVVGLFDGALPIIEFSIGNGVTPLFTASGGERLWLSLFGRGSGAGESAYFASYQAGAPAIGLGPAFLSADLGFPNWVRLSSVSGSAPRSYAFSVEGDVIPGPGTCAAAGLVLLAARRRRAAVS